LLTVIDTLRAVAGTYFGARSVDCVPLFHFMVKVTLAVPFDGVCGTAAEFGVAVPPPPEQPATRTASIAAPRRRVPSDLGGRFTGKTPIRISPLPEMLRAGIREHDHPARTGEGSSMSRPDGRPVRDAWEIRCQFPWSKRSVNFTFGEAHTGMVRAGRRPKRSQESTPPARE
jgi:hypothetical protein